MCVYIYKYTYAFISFICIYVYMYMYMCKFCTYIYIYIYIYIFSSYKIHPKDFLIFLNVELSSIIFFLYFRRELSELKKLKKSHPNKISYIQKTEISWPRKNSCISGRTSKAPKTKNSYTSPQKAIHKFF